MLGISWDPRLADESVEAASAMLCVPAVPTGAVVAPPPLRRPQSSAARVGWQGVSGRH